MYRKICLNCGKNFESIYSKRKCCSRKCINRDYYINVGKYLYKKKKLIEIECKNPICKKKIFTKGFYRTSKKYCSKKCIATAQYYRDRKPSDKEKLRTVIRGFSRTRFAIFSDLKENKCKICNSKKNLEIHHKKYTRNHKNWQLLCRRCHNNLHNIKKNHL